MDKKLLVDFLRKANAINVPQNFTGQVTFSINFNQGGIVSIERNVRETIIK